MASNTFPTDSPSPQSLIILTQHRGIVLLIPASISQAWLPSSKRVGSWMDQVRPSTHGPCSTRVASTSSALVSTHPRTGHLAMNAECSMVSLVTMTSPLYPSLHLKVVTPKLELHGATDDLLAQLLPSVRAGVVLHPPYPFDDPMSWMKTIPCVSGNGCKPSGVGAAPCPRHLGVCTLSSCGAGRRWACRI
jgi:hypothetical protein